MNEESTPSLGTCCLCEGTANVRTILNVAKKAPTPGRGWGCLVCELPNDGAIAVLCDVCCEKVQAGAAPKFACQGYPATDGRVLFTELQGEHKHDRVRHAQLDIPGGLGQISQADLEAIEQVRFGVELDGMTALALLGSLQLACQHSVFKQAGFTYQTALNFGKFLQAEIAVTPNLQEITERGWNPQQVQPVQSRIIIPGRG